MNIARNLLCAGLIAALTLALAGCGEGTGSGGDKAAVAATIWPMANLTQQLVGDDVQVACLLPPGLSPHSFEPTAAQMRELAGAKLLVTVGLGLDHWAWSAAEATGRKDLPKFVFADAVGIAGEHDAAGEHAHAHGEHADHDEHGEEHEADRIGPAAVQVGVNEHLWLDPVLVEQMLPKLAAELERVLPDHKATIEANLTKLLADIKQLDADYKSQLANMPNKAIVTFHDAFNRLADRYGLTVAATLMPIETPGGASPQRLEQVLAAVSKYELKTIFAEPQFSPEVAETLANEIHIHVMTLDPLGDPHIPDRSTYQKMMRYNLQTLIDGLNGD